MKLLEIYSRVTGLKIGKQHLLEKYFPLPKESPYILLHASSGMPSKNYPFYNEVMSILGPILTSNNITVYQIGSKEDTPIHGCVHLMGQTSLHQTNYLIKRAILLVGNDSFSQHRAGHLGVPLVGLFGPTSVENHSPFEHTENSIFLSSHRWGRNPSFSNNEPESSIALIPPEQVVNAVLKLLGANITLNRKSLLIGNKYTSSVIEWVPDTILSPDFLKGAPIMARCDLGGDENTLFQTLSARKLHILTRTPLNIQALTQLKGNIEQLVIEFSQDSLISPEYIKQIKSLGVKLVCFTYDLDGDELAQKRLEFFDYCQILKIGQKGKENFINDVRRYLNDPSFTFDVGPNKWFRSNKFILARGKFYLSKFHFMVDIPTENMGKNVSQIVDHEEFWKEQDYFYFFNQEVQS